MKPDYKMSVSMYCRVSKIPEPESEIKFHPVRRWRFDFAWIDKKIALEVEGGVFTGGRHTRGKGFMNDMEKYNNAALLGWTVIRCTPTQLKNGQIFILLRELFNKTIPG